MDDVERMEAARRVKARRMEDAVVSTGGAGRVRTIAGRFWGVRRSLGRAMRAERTSAGPVVVEEMGRVYTWFGRLFIFKIGFRFGVPRELLACGSCVSERLRAFSRGLYCYFGAVTRM